MTMARNITGFRHEFRNNSWCHWIKNSSVKATEVYVRTRVDERFGYCRLRCRGSGSWLRRSVAFTMTAGGRHTRSNGGGHGG